MGKNRKWIQIVIMAAVIVVGGFTIGSSLFYSDGVLKEGDRLPDFTLTGLDGELYSLSDFRGQPVVINFWGTFCPPCREEMPALQAASEKWKEQGVTVVGINLGEDRIRVNSFVQETGVTFPILLDRSFQVTRSYNVIYYPTTFFVDERGRIVHKIEVEANELMLDRLIASLLN